MPRELESLYRERLARADRTLAAVTEAAAAEPYPGGSWTRKQVLGHLLDSATNNHFRFGHAAQAGSLAVPGYAQREWVDWHDYAALPWADLLAHWRSRNELLTRLVAGLPEPVLSAPCRIGEDPEVTLEFLIRDYLDHLDHHVRQITGSIQ